MWWLIDSKYVCYLANIQNSIITFITCKPFLKHISDIKLTWTSSCMRTNTERRPCTHHSQADTFWRQRECQTWSCSTAATHPYIWPRWPCRWWSAVLCSNSIPRGTRIGIPLSSTHYLERKCTATVTTGSIHHSSIIICEKDIHVINIVFAYALIARHRYTFNSLIKLKQFFFGIFQYLILNTCWRFIP